MTLKLHLDILPPRHYKYIYYTKLQNHIKKNYHLNTIAIKPDIKAHNDLDTIDILYQTIKP